MHIDVKSVVIDWQAKNMEIKAQDLGRYMSQGYMILGIDFEEGEGL